MVKVYQFGSVRFEGTKEEFRSWYVNVLTERIIAAQAKRLLIQTTDIDEVIRRAECEDIWCIEAE